MSRDNTKPCNRTACDAPAHPECIHRTTQERYCVGCARRINHACGERVVSWPVEDKRGRATIPLNDEDTTND